MNMPDDYLGGEINDFTDVLIEILSDLIDEGFELPIYIFAVSQNGCVVAARYEGNPSGGGVKPRIYTDHIESGGWEQPIHCFFVDGTGKSQVVKIEPESLTDTLGMS
jgi:hypothetical protein